MQKNAMHYVDNSLAPYQVGGITKAGEVWRLFNKAFAPGRDRLNVVKGPGATGLDVHASYDPVARRYHLFSANFTAGSVPLDIDLGALPAAAGSRVLLEEVSETTAGAGKTWTNLSAQRMVSGTQGANTVWLLTVSRDAPHTELSLTATDDAEARDGANRGKHYGATPTMTARNDPADTAARSVAFIKFALPTNDLSRLDFAVLSLSAASATVNAPAQAHIYGLTNSAWSQATLTWSNAPNLKQNVAAGVTIAGGFVAGQGTNAFILGQLLTTATAASEKFVDVTTWLRGHTGSNVSFLVSQDPRKDITLPSLAVGDTQPDGVKLLTTESGAGPRLHLTFRPPAPTALLPVWTNVPARAEAVVRGGSSADVDQDEAATGYLMVKHYPTPFDLARKTCFQFDLGGLNVNHDTQAVFSVVTHTQNFAQRAQLWGLDQDYAGFSAGITWNNAQANDTASNDLLTRGPFTATAIGNSVLLPSTASTTHSFTIPRLGDFVFNQRAHLVLSGVEDAANNAGGLRLARNSATLTVLAGFPVLRPAITGITNNLDGTVTIAFLGRVQQSYLVQATSNLAAPHWIAISTNVADDAGAWTFTDSTSLVQTSRFYRAAQP